MDNQIEIAVILGDNPNHIRFAAEMLALSLASAMSAADEVFHAIRDRIKSDDLGWLDELHCKFCQWATLAWFDEMDRNKIEQA